MRPVLFYIPVYPAIYTVLTWIGVAFMVWRSREVGQSFEEAIKSKRAQSLAFTGAIITVALWKVPDKLPIFSYGVMLGLSLVVGWYIVLGLGARDGYDREKLGKLYVETAVASVVGARLLYIFTNAESFLEHPIKIFYIWEGGLVAYGGFIGGFILGVVRARAYGIPLLAWADCVVPSLGTGLAVTRIGCFMFGCDFGKPAAALSWAVQFPKGSPAWNEQLKQGLITAQAQASLPVHPTQIYEALFGLALFGVTMLVRRWRTFSGQMFIAFTMAYAVGRFFIETLRADEQRGGLESFGIPLSTSQVIGIGTFLATAALFVVLRARETANPGSLRLWGKQAEAEVVPAPAPKKKRRKR